MKKIILMLAGMLIASSSAYAEDRVEYEIHIKDHKFTPDVLEVPVDTKIKLVVMNDDPTPEEFESHSLNREKIIRGNSKGIVFIGPLEAGEYEFFGEFNEATAQGKIIAK